MIKINWNEKFDREHIDFIIARIRVLISIEMQIPFEITWGCPMGSIENIIMKEINNDRQRTISKLLS